LWDKKTCDYAAEGGHLEVLKWARDNGCPWGSDTCLYAAENGHLDILQYLWANGCPRNATLLLMKAMEYRHFDMWRWLNDQNVVC
jgi:hypothetical protein